MSCGLEEQFWICADKSSAFQDNHRGSTWQWIKMASDDLMSTSTRMDEVRERGLFPDAMICVDVWDVTGPAGEGTHLFTRRGAYERGGNVEVVPWGDAWGGMLRSWEEVSSCMWELDPVASPLTRILHS